MDILLYTNKTKNAVWITTICSTIKTCDHNTQSCGMYTISAPIMISFLPQEMYVALTMPSLNIQIKHIYSFPSLLYSQHFVAKKAAYIIRSGYI